MADSITKATYKRYSSTNGWQTIYFYTGADQVGETSALWFLRPTNTVNGKSFTKNGGLTISTNDINLGSDVNNASVTFNDLTFELNENNTVSEAFVNAWNAMYNLQAELEKKDSALDARISKIEGAYTDGTIITTSNMGEKITKVGTVASGKWQGTAIEDAYIASASKWNAKQDALKWDTAPTANSTNPVTSGGVKAAIDTVAAIAQGKTNTYVIEGTNTQSGYSNSSFNISQKSETDSVTVSGTAKVIDVNNVEHSISELKIGDIVLTRESSVKDFYLGKTDLEKSTLTFYEIDSDKPDLTDYAKTSEVTSKISAAIQALDSSKDAGSGKYLQSITITDGKITGGMVGTIPTSLPASNTTSDYSSTGTNPVNGAAVNKALGQSVSKTATGNGLTVTLGGTIQSPTLAVSAAAGSVASGNSNVVSGGTVYNYVKDRATKIYYQASSSAPTGMIEGDIWIAY